MSLYLAIGIAAAVAIFLRFRYGSEVISYAAAVLLLILFLYCPSGLQPGIHGLVETGRRGLEDRVDRLGDVISFGLLILAAWIAGGPGKKRST